LKSFSEITEEIDSQLVKLVVSSSFEQEEKRTKTKHNNKIRCFIFKNFELNYFSLLLVTISANGSPSKNLPFKSKISNV